MEVAQLAPNRTRGPFLGLGVPSFPFLIFFDVDPGSDVETRTGGVEVHQVGAFDFLAFLPTGVSPTSGVAGFGLGSRFEVDAEEEVGRGREARLLK